jgi:hypothetical protein
MYTETAAALRAVGRRWFERWLESDVVFQRPAILSGDRAVDDAGMLTP